MPFFFFFARPTATVKALEKCRDMQERMTLVLKDMTERLGSDLIAPLTVFVEEQGGSVKEACRKVDKTQEKRRHASLNPGTNALTLAKSSTISKTDLKALELVNSFCNAASLECVRTFTLLFKFSSFVVTSLSLTHHQQQRVHDNNNNNHPSQTTEHCSEQETGL